MIDNFSGEWRIEAVNPTNRLLHNKVVSFFEKNKFTIEETGGADVYARGFSVIDRINNFLLRGPYKINKDLAGSDDIKALLKDFGRVEFTLVADRDSKLDTARARFYTKNSEKFGDSFHVTLRRISSLPKARLHFKVKTPGRKEVKAGESFVANAVVTNLGPGPIPADGTTVYLYMSDSGAEVKLLQSSGMNCFESAPANGFIWCQMEALYGKFGNREAKGRFKVRITVPQNFSEKKLVGYVISEANDVIGPQEQLVKAREFFKRVKPATKDRLALSGLWKLQGAVSPLIVRFTGSNGVMEQGPTIPECEIRPGTIIYRNLVKQGNAYYYAGEQLGRFTSTGKKLESHLF